MSFSSINFPSHPYHRQSRSPSYQSSSPHPTQSAAAVESSLAPSDLPQNLAVPGRGVANLADSTPSPVPRLSGGDLEDLTQGPRSGVRGVRSYSSPPLTIGLNTGLSDSSFSPGPVYPASTLGAQPTSQLSYQNRGRLSATDLRVPDYSLPQRPSEIGSEVYLPRNMAPEAPSWSWQGRPSHSHLQSSSMGYDQQLPSSQSLSPESFPLGYNVPQGSPRGYYQPGGLPSPYLSVPSAGPSQAASHPRSVSMSYALPGSTAPGNVPNMSNQSYMPHSPSYFPSHSDYFLPETSVPSHSSSIPVRSPQPPPGPPLYSSPDPGSASASTSTDPDGQVRVLSFRPKPQCWDHGCNGREFSTFSNLLRHQREKSGVVAKAECPVCGAAFTRTTARNIHVAQGKCKGGRESSAG